MLEDLQRRDNGEVERGFVVHRTSDPRWLDPAVDPNARKPNWCYLGDPRAVTTAQPAWRVSNPSGLAVPMVL